MLQAMKKKTGFKKILEKTIFKKDSQERALWRDTNRVEMSQVNRSSAI